jgi:hypothetical protein
VISITTDPSNLFDYEKGIFVKGKVFDDWVKGGGNPNGDEPWTFPGNFTQRGREWEREVNMEFFEPDGTLGFSQKLGMRISGNATRTYNKKSLRFYARGEYGKKNVNYDLLPGLTSMSDRSTPVTKFDTFILRTGGNDSDYSKIRDIYNQELVKDRSFDTQGYRPAVVFIDGEYWGVYSVMQDFNDKYIENHYGVPAEEVITVTNWYEVDDGENDDANLYRSLINFARNNDLSVQSNYDMISTMMDVKNYIEYYIAEIYIANDDWPQNNVKVWRARNVDSSNPYMDGKWRWMMHDTDISMNLYDRPETSQTADTLSVALNYNGDSAVLFSALMKNDGFRTEFKETVNDMKNKEFNPSNALSVLDEIVTKYKPMIRDDMYRNGPSWVVQWTNPPEKHFYDEVDKIKAFVSSRASYLDTMIANNLD